MFSKHIRPAARDLHTKIAPIVRYFRGIPYRLVVTPQFAVWVEHPKDDPYLARRVAGTR